MFCHECGSKLEDGAKFCQKCGIKILCTDEGNGMPIIPIVEKEQTNTSETESSQRSFSSASVRHVQPQINNNLKNVSKKKKTKKTLVFLMPVILVSIVIIIAMNWNDKIDYIATVSAHQPFAYSQELTYTYEEVLNKYIDSPKWEVREDGDIHYVDISGTMKGTDYKLVVTVKVSLDSSDSDIAWISPETVIIDGEQSPTQNDAAEFLCIMFMAYDEGYDDFFELLSQTELPEVQGGISEPIESYYELSGAYIGSMEQSTLSLSIYSSQEEGELAIGNVVIYVSGGLYYYFGEIVPIEKNVYKVIVDTGEEVLLVASVSGDNIVLRLCIDEQYIEEYWMEEHYES